jgi:hypothetical protein
MKSQVLRGRRCLVGGRSLCGDLPKKAAMGRQILGAPLVINGLLNQVMTCGDDDLRLFDPYPSISTIEISIS